MKSQGWVMMVAGAFLMAAVVTGRDRGVPSLSGRILAVSELRLAQDELEFCEQVNTGLEKQNYAWERGRDYNCEEEIQDWTSCYYGSIFQSLGHRRLQWVPR